MVNPVDALCGTWDYRHYNTFRRLARAGDWVGLAQAVKACSETAVVEATLSRIKEASPRLHAMVTTDRALLVILATPW